MLEIGRIRMPDMFDLTWDKPRAAGAAPAPAGGRRAHRRRRQRRPAARRGRRRRGRRARSSPKASRRSPSAFINSYRNPAHEQRRRGPACARRIPRSAGDGLLRRPAREQGIRAHQHDGGQRLSAGRHARATCERLESGLRAIGIAAPILRHHLQRRHAGGRRRLREAGVRGRPPARPAASSARRGWARRAASPTSSSSTWAARRPRPSIIEDGRPSMTSEYEFRDGISTLEPLHQGRRLHAQGAGHRHRRGRRRRRLDRRHRQGRPAQGRSANRPAPCPAPPATASATTRPTVTDANVVLGLHQPDSSLAGGRLAIDRRAEPSEAIAGACRRAARARRSRTPRTAFAPSPTPTWRAPCAPSPSSAGRDPRDLTLIAFGGNGGVHAPDVAPTARHRAASWCPPLAGVFSAVGMLASDVEHIALRHCPAPLDALTRRRARADAAAPAPPRSTRGWPPTASRRRPTRSSAFEADLRHDGQASELTVPVRRRRRSRALARALRRRIPQDLRISRTRADRAGEAARRRPRPARAPAGLRPA